MRGQEEPQVENFAYIVVKSDGNFLHRSDEKLVIKLLAGLSDAEEIITERILKIGRYGSCTEVMVVMADGKLKLIEKNPAWQSLKTEGGSIDGQD